MKINIKQIFSEAAPGDKNWVENLLEEDKPSQAEAPAPQESEATAQEPPPGIPEKVDAIAPPEPVVLEVEAPAAAAAAEAAVEDVQVKPNRPVLEPEAARKPEAAEGPSIPVRKPKAVEKPETTPKPEAEDVQEEQTQEAPQAESAADGPQPKPLHKKYGKYGWVAGIAVAFIALLAVMVVYTTMIPRDVYATINGETYIYTSTEHTVGGFLEEKGIDYCEEDYLSTPVTTFIYDGINFDLKHAVDFKITVDGKTSRYKTLEDTVEDALKEEKIKLGEKDMVTPALETPLTAGMHIVVQRVEIQEITVEEEVPFKTVEKDDGSMDEGKSKVVTEGQNGLDKVTYAVTYVDGVESSRTEIRRETVTAAVDKVVANGTRISLGGISYSKKLVVKAYAYTGGGITAMGTRARVGEIAVDPRVIPLGTTVYIEGVGMRRAEDTGGNIKGNTIDIYMNTQAECIRWGVRYVTIYIQ